VTPIPLLSCASVAESSGWYQRVLGLASGHGGDEYEMLMDGDTLVLQLHHLDAHDHAHLVRRGEPLGNGVAVWFRTDRYREAVARVRSSGAQVLEDDHVNENAHHREVWVRDPDGYVVVISGPPGITD
jgi:catechol 2,3-dioxygenase-like lactoylglutathione lyase family enzyme